MQGGVLTKHKHTLRTGVILSLLFLVIVAGTLPSVAQRPTPLTVKERYEAMAFGTGHLVIPMDEKQNNTVLAFGVIHALLRNGTVCYRLIGPPAHTIKTEELPDGANYTGGPVVIMDANLTVLSGILDIFPGVTVHNITGTFVSRTVYKIERPTKILLLAR
jgi:hypothetical protein